MYESHLADFRSQPKSLEVCTSRKQIAHHQQLGYCAVRCPWSQSGRARCCRPWGRWTCRRPRPPEEPKTVCPVFDRGSQGKICSTGFWHTWILGCERTNKLLACKQLTASRVLRGCTMDNAIGHSTKCQNLSSPVIDYEKVFQCNCLPSGWSYISCRPPWCSW